MSQEKTEAQVLVEETVEILREEVGEELLITVVMGGAPRWDFTQPVKALDYSLGSDFSKADRSTLIFVDAPLGHKSQALSIDNSQYKLPGNWICIQDALSLVADDGYLAAIVEPSGFTTTKGKEFLGVLKKKEWHLSGLIEFPAGAIKNTEIQPILSIFSRESSDDIVVASVKRYEDIGGVIEVMACRESTGSLDTGLLVCANRFQGFDHLRVALEIEKLESGYKEYKAASLADISKHIVFLKDRDVIKDGGESIFIEDAQKLKVHKFQASLPPTSRGFKVILGKGVRRDYLVAYFESELGQLSLRSARRGSVMKSLSVSSLKEIPIALPLLEEQKMIASSRDCLQDVSDRIKQFKRDLSLNPKTAADILKSMKSTREVLDKLTESDRILYAIMAGESRNTEFKETFSVDKKTGKKEKFIEHQVVKTLAAFLNTLGGRLLVGVADDQSVCGLNDEIKKYYNGSSDRFLLHVSNVIREKLGIENMELVDYDLVLVDGLEVLSFRCEASDVPCYVDGKEFYIRVNPATNKLEGPQLVKYISMHFSKEEKRLS